MTDSPDDNSRAQRNITGFWSSIAGEYEAHEGNVPPPGSAEHEAWIAVIRDALPAAPSDVLDVGTGTGFVARTAASLGHRVTAIDLSEEMLAIAREHARNEQLDVTFGEGDAVAPPFDPATFDALTSRHLLWTLREPEQAFRNWRRLLRPGGRVVAFDGFWFPADRDEEPGGEEPDIFKKAYQGSTRAALPFMGLTSAEPIIAAFRQAGYRDSTFASLDAINEAAGRRDEPAPYVIVASAP